MANSMLSIQCPICGSQILFDPYELVRGVRFACPTCPDVSIGLDQCSQGIVQKTLDELENIKKHVGEKRLDESFSKALE